MNKYCPLPTLGQGMTALERTAYPVKQNQRQVKKAPTVAAKDPWCKERGVKTVKSEMRKLKMRQLEKMRRKRQLRYTSTLERLHEVHMKGGGSTRMMSGS